MAPSDALSPPRRPIFFPVVIATVFLTIIGMAVGYILGERHRDRMRAEQQNQTRPQPTTVVEPSSAAPSGPFCPEETRATAASLGFPADLRRVLKVVTEGGTTAWICQDPAGALYYQGKTGGVDAPLVEKKNGLFLSRVSRTGPNEFSATAANGNQITVTRRQLEVNFADGRAAQVEKVESAE